MYAPNRVCGLAALLLAGVLAFRPVLPAQPAASFSGDFDPARALAVVYGSLNWSDPRLRDFADFSQGHAFVTPAFDAAFTEQGIDKHVVIAALTPHPLAAYSCNACAPLLGGAVFRKEGGRWSVESIGQIIDSTQAHRSLALIRIGPDRHALLHETARASGGYEARTARLVFAVGATLASRFTVRSPEFGESPGPGACGFPSEQGLTLRMDAKSGAGAAYYEAVVEERRNDVKCATVTLEDGRPASQWSGSACTRIARYRVRGDHYELLAVERNECGPARQGTSSWEG
jgi:hypothetical protein